MAVTSIRYISKTSNVTVKKNSHTLTTRVISDVANEDPFLLAYQSSVLLGAGFGLGDSFPSDGSSKLQSINSTISNPDENKIWQVVFSYESLDPQETDFTLPPTARPDIESYTSQEIEIVADFDWNGDAIQNSAKQQFENQPTRKILVDVLNITKNISTGSWSQSLLQFKNKTNDSTWRTANAGVALCTQVDRSDLMKETINQVDYEFYQLQMQFQFRWENPLWKTSILDAGIKELSGTTLKNIIINGQAVTESVLLDGSGAAQLTSTPVVNFLEFTMFGSADFSAGLGV